MRRTGQSGRILCGEQRGSHADIRSQISRARIYEMEIAVMNERTWVFTGKKEKKSIKSTKYRET